MSRSGLFFERGIVDALGMLHEVGALPDNELQALLSTYPYQRRVFLFPPWEAIYSNDAERDQTFVEATRVYRGGLSGSSAAGTRWSRYEARRCGGVRMTASAGRSRLTGVRLKSANHACSKVVSGQAAAHRCEAPGFARFRGRAQRFVN